MKNGLYVHFFYKWIIPFLNKNSGNLEAINMKNLIIGLVIGLVLGGLIGYFIGNQSQRGYFPNRGGDFQIDEETKQSIKSFFENV